MDRTTLPRLRDRRPLGERGLLVGPYGLEVALEPHAVAAAYEAGVNLFAVYADHHWAHTEGLLRGLRDLLAARPGVRDDIVVAAVPYVTAPRMVARAIADVLEAAPELGHVDVVLAGGGLTADLEGRRPLLAALRRDHHAGASAAGATVVSVEACRALAGAADLDLLCTRFNPAFPQLVDEVLADPALADAPRRPAQYVHKTHFAIRTTDAAYDAIGLTAAHWRPTHGDLYRFALTPARVDGLLFPVRSPRGVQALADAIDGGPLAPDEQRYLRRLTRRLLAHGGPPS